MNSLNTSNKAQMGLLKSKGWAAMVKSEKCRVCSGSIGRIFYRADVAYGVCETCRAINKLLTEDEFNRLGATYDPGALLDVYDHDTLREFLSVDTNKKRLLPLIARMVPKKNDQGPLRLLDIGCGMGGYLLAGRELGLDVEGIEPSETHSQIGRNSFGLPIQTDFFSKGMFNGRRFNIVILSHVIEHVFDPKGFLRDISDIVAPDGVIVLYTPNSASLIATLTGARWSMLSPVDHVTMMTPKSMVALTPSGFESKISTDEILWEPAVVLLQALRDILKSLKVRKDPALSGNGTIARSNSFRGTIATINSHTLLRIALSFISVPLWILGRLNNKSHCIYAEYQRIDGL